MGGRHRLDAAVERLDELVHRAAALAGVHRHHRDAGQDVFDAVVELRDQHVLAFFGTLACGDVASEPLEQHEPPGRIELGARGLLEPDLLAVRPDEAEGQRIGRFLRAHAAHMRLELGAVVGMHMLEEAARGERLARIEAEDLRGIVAAARGAGAHVPFERGDGAGGERLLQAGLALPQHRLVPAPFREQRRQHEGAERHRNDAGLRSEDAIRGRHARIAEHADPEGRRPHDGQGDDERRGRREHRPAPRGEPQQHRKQQRDRNHRRPGRVGKRDHQRAHQREHGECRTAFDELAVGRRVAHRRRDPDQERRHRDDAERIRREPVMPGGQDRRRRMLEIFERERAADPGRRGRDDRAHQQAEHVAQPVETELRTEIALDQRGAQQRLTGIAERKDDRSRESPVAEEICHHRRTHGAGGDRPSRGRAERDHGAGGNAGGRPEHRNAIGLGQQEQAQLGGQEIDRSGHAGEPSRASPPLPDVRGSGPLVEDPLSQILQHVAPSDEF